MRHAITVFSILGLLAVAGCNTAEGIGEDIEAAGEAIEEEAED